MAVQPKRPNQNSRFSRRDVVKAGGVSALTLAAAGSLGPQSLARQSTPDATEAVEITIQDIGATLPSDDVTFRWIDNGGAKNDFFDAYFPAYQAAHPNIEISRDVLPTPEVTQAVTLGVRNGNAHDVFQVFAPLTAAQVVREGWVLPLDDIIPDFANWKAALPAGALANGVTDFEGKTYTIPVNGTAKEYHSLLYFNPAYLEQAGFDPAAAPLTWDEFREAAHVVTEQGQGEYYGLILGASQTGSLATIIRNFARMAGAPVSGDDIDYRTGEYGFTNEAYIEAINLLLAIQSDGSIFPESRSIGLQEAAARVPTGVAGMLFDGPWNIPIWERDFAGFEFNIGSQPVPNAEPMPIPFGASSGTFWVFSETPYPEIAGDLLAYLGTEAGVLAFQAYSGAPRSSIFPSVDQATFLDERTRRAFALYDEQMRAAPDPQVRNPDVARVFLELQAVTPNFGDVVQGLLVGQLDDPAEAMQDLKDRSEAALDAAIAAAQEQGAEVSRDDFVFGDWNPTEDYQPT